jgi:tetratricopeptide (TPR) repeat protein
MLARLAPPATAPSLRFHKHLIILNPATYSSQAIQMIQTIWLTVLLLQELTQQVHPSRSSNSAAITGKVISRDRLELGLLRAQLIEIGSQRVLAESMLNVAGGFQLPAPPNGIFEFRIIGQAGESRYSLEIQSATSSYLEIQLPERGLTTQSATISAQRLQHKTPRKAQQQIDAATRNFKKGNRLKAIEDLLLGSTFDPDNFDIASNIGALYLKERDPEKALPWLNKAWLIDPNDSPNNTNLSAYYAYQNDYAKAEEYAAASLRTNPTSTHARYMLAVSLLKQGKDTEGARSHLNQIQGAFSPAKALLLSMQPKE